MSREEVTRTFKITTSPEVMRRFERFLAFLHWNSRYGHSGIFAMSLDGDGAERFTASPAPGHSDEVSLCGGIGHQVGIAESDGYHGGYLDRERGSDWRVRPLAGLYKNGKLVKAVPDDISPGDDDA